MSDSTPLAPRSALEAPPRPGPSAPRDYNFPRFERRTLPNGLRLVVAPVHKLPVVSVVAVLDAGAVCDPEGQEGLADLCASMLTEGTTSRDAVELTQQIERLGASLGAGADWDGVFVSLTTLTRHVEPAFALFAEVLTQPVFPEREIERLKAERIAELLHLETEPRGLADEAFARALYGADSRYAKPEGGSRTSVPTLTRDAVAAFHAARYRPRATTLIIVGDCTVEQGERLALGALGDWSGDAPPRPTSSDRSAAQERRAHLVVKRDAQQSELRVGHVGVPRVHPDYFSIVVMNAILGGLFNSRVNLNLREEHGYTYGAHSGFDWRVQAGPFVVASAVQSEHTAPAAREVLGEIDRIRAEPVAAEELSLATSYLDGVFPIRYETTAAIASALANLTIFGLPDDYFDTYRTRIRAVTIEDVQRAAVTHLHPDRLQLLVAGDPDAVRAPLEALGFGPLLVTEPEGAPSA